MVSVECIDFRDVNLFSRVEENGYPRLDATPRIKRRLSKFGL